MAYRADKAEKSASTYAAGRGFLHNYSFSVKFIRRILSLKKRKFPYIRRIFGILSGSRQKRNIIRAAGKHRTQQAFHAKIFICRSTLLSFLAPHGFLPPPRAFVCIFSAECVFSKRRRSSSTKRTNGTDKISARAMIT